MSITTADFEPAKKPGASVRERVLLASQRLRRVKAIDRAATWTITAGGLLLIVAVLFIFVFILSETLPLFRPARGSALATLALSSGPGDALGAGTEELRAAAAPAGLALGTEEYQRYLYQARADGAVALYRTSDGALVRTVALPELQGVVISSASRSALGDAVAFGTADGRAVLLEARFVPRYQDEQLADLDFDARARGTYTLDPAGRPLHSICYEEQDGRRIVAAAVGPDEIALVHTDDEGAEHHATLRTENGEAVVGIRVGRSETLFAATAAGTLYHWELTPEVRLTERTVVSEHRITSLELALGSVTALVADESGALSAWFRVRRNESDDEPRFVRAHDYPPQAAPIVAIGISTRGKAFVTAARDGSVVLRHMTSERSLVSFPATGRTPRAVLLTPRMDGILVEHAGERTVARYQIEAPHPEISWQALFGKVWYEGYGEPGYVWQSTGGTDDFETKFSLVPLVFGTIKGTFYALLFALPLAVMAALYTSQFVHLSIKAKVKPTVEIMAALPSVVVGFIAGLWLAARVERALVPVLLMIVLLPLFGTAGVLFWHRLPLGRTLRPGMELWLLLPLVVAGALVASAIGPLVEGWLFGGDLRLWLSSALGLIYDQRNSLVVGLAMGFAIIPIIFTIAEDAFSSVPAHLKAASLALGASRWQTAVRVVLPTASPGVFSAAMIGFGRAVGETMIVLMATGNTPVLDWSMFNGMRTLSANIAVEIPEAPHAGTLYRTLFLAALVLFVLTFVVNTLAELVRQRLRERYRAL